MGEFAGFNGWVEIFKGGPQVDSRGKEWDGDAIIDKAVASFNAAEHEPPITVGHPKDNEPAFGWVKGLKSDVVDGVQTLFMRSRDVVPEFEGLVKAGRYKKRSAAFYPDGRLRHVGFLGAMPPAVKGLADLKFNEDEQYIEFYDRRTGMIAGIMSGIRDLLVEKFGVDAADRAVPAWELDTLKEEADRAEETPETVYQEQPETMEETMATEEKQFSEADVKAAEEAAAAKAREETQQEAVREFAETRRREKIDAFCEKTWPENGNPALPPALLDAGVKAFMERLDGSESIEFAEGGDKQSQLDWFLGFLEGLPQSIHFKEVAKRGEDLPDNDDSEDIARRALEYQESEKKAGRVITVTQAVAHVTAQ